MSETISSALCEQCPSTGNTRSTGTTPTPRSTPSTERAPRTETTPCNKRHASWEANAYKRIKVHEGKRLSIYEDRVKRADGTVDVVMTVGYGHRVRRDEEELYGKPAGTKVSQEVIDKLYEKDFSTAVSDAKNIVRNFDRLPDEVKEVLVNMSFQLGIRNLNKFHGMLRALDEGNYKKAAEEMQFRDSSLKEKGHTPWYEQSKNRAVELVHQMRSASSN